MSRRLLLPSGLARHAIKGWMFPAHIRQLQRAILETLFNPDRNRLIISLPTRHGKSYYCSFLLPTWWLLTHPDSSIGIISYGSEFAEEWSDRVRRLITECGPLFNVALDQSFRSRSHFRLAPPHAGQLRGLGIGGSLAGKGFDLIIADDLVKDQSEVISPEARAKLRTAFSGELLTRLEPGGKVIVIMSRRHPEDLSGTLIASNSSLKPAQQWHQLTLPALSDDGVALWPDRWPANELEAIRHRFDLDGELFWWAGLYQQDPMEASAYLEWPSSYWKDLYYDHLPAFTPRMRLMSLDPSMGKDRKKGDYSCLLRGLVDPDGTLWLPDPLLVRRPVPALEDLSVAVAREFRPDAWIIETNQFQEVVAQNIIDKSKDRPLPIHPCVSVGDKEVRIRMALSPLLRQGKIKIEDTPAGRLLGNQLRDFPLGRFDDGPDSLTLMTKLWMDLLAAPSDDAQPEEYEPIRLG